MFKVSRIAIAIVVLALTASAALAANIFNYRAITGDSGANRFWVTDQNVYQAAGADVAGRFSSTSVDAWLTEAQRLYGVTALCTNITGPDYPAPRQRASGDYIISGNDVAGRCIFDLGVDVATVCAANITGPNYPAPRYRANAGDWILSGNDVAGRCIFDGPIINETGVFTGSDRATSGYNAFVAAASAAGVLD